MRKTYDVDIKFISDNLLSDSYMSDKVNDILTILNNYSTIMKIPLKSYMNDSYSVGISFTIKIKPKNINNFTLDILKIKDCIELNIK